MSIISLEKLLKSDAPGTLNKIVQTAQNMDKLTSALRQRLSPDAAANLLAATVDENEALTLIATSSAWATTLRFESETLLTAAIEHGEKVSSCRVSVTKNF